MATTTDTLRNFIDGESVARRGRDRSRTEPRHRRGDGARADLDAEEVDSAVMAARRAFAGWSNTTPAQRSAALLALADLIEEHGARSPAWRR